jgi:hypothetical protein
MKKFFMSWGGLLFPARETPRITYCAIPKEVWMADLKKASDYSQRFPGNDGREGLRIQDKMANQW